MVLNEEQWIKELREKRIAYGISQGRLAVASGITREYFNKIESGKMKPSKELLETLYKELARFNPEAPLTMLFDYVKIRFPTLDIHIVEQQEHGSVGIEFLDCFHELVLHIVREVDLSRFDTVQVFTADTSHDCKPCLGHAVR